MRQPKMSTEPDEDVVLDAEGLSRSAHIALVLQRCGCCARLSVTSEADLLEPQEVWERRDRLDNEGRWALVAALHDGST